MYKENIVVGLMPTRRPVFKIETAKEEYRVIMPLIRRQLPGNVTFVRFDLPWNKNGITGIKRPFVKSAVEVQPPDTVVIDLTKSNDTILREMKKKTRYNIRLAERKGVEIRRIDDELLPEWYEIYQETAERDKIGIHSIDYYLTVYREIKRSSFAEPLLLGAYIEGRLSAGIFIVLCQDKATYLYGASSDSYRNYMPNYLLQWEGLRRAKAAGCREYDMYGIPPEDDPDHPMYGLYRFKTGFGGEIVHMAGCYDYPVRIIPYYAYRAMEMLRNFYYKRLKKR